MSRTIANSAGSLTVEANLSMEFPSCYHQVKVFLFEQILFSGFGVSSFNSKVHGGVVQGSLCESEHFVKSESRKETRNRE